MGSETHILIHQGVSAHAHAMSGAVVEGGTWLSEDGDSVRGDF